MSDNEHAIIAFDGLSLAGKSTMVQMLLERSLDAVVIRENTFDPIRPATSRLNKLWKQGALFSYGINQVADEFPQFEGVLDEAIEYIDYLKLEGPSLYKNRQAVLAYMFTAGRKIVNEEVAKQSQSHDVILDRWLISGCAYQVQPPTNEDEPFSWMHIRDLNEDMGVWYPHSQVILTCPLDQIPERRAYRQKEGVGTSGQMSGGKEEILYKAFMEINTWLINEDRPSKLIENLGKPCENIEDQIRQAIPIYLKLEEELKKDIEAGVYNYKLAQDKLSLSQAEGFFLQPEVLNRIYERQTSKK